MAHFNVSRTILCKKNYRAIGVYKKEIIDKKKKKKTPLPIQQMCVKFDISQMTTDYETFRRTFPFHEKRDGSDKGNMIFVTFYSTCDLPQIIQVLDNNNPITYHCFQT